MDAAVYGLLETRLPDTAERLLAATPSGIVEPQTYRSELVVSGSGYLHMIAADTANPTTSISGHSVVHWRITVDGGTPCEVGNSSLYPAGQFGDRSVKGIFLGIRFAKSLTVEIYNTHSQAHNIDGCVIYSLDG